MKVHTFFKPIFEFGQERTDRELALIDLWKKSWKFYGWEPIVHSHEELPILENYQQLKNKIKDFPTRNNREYEEACYLRWLLMQEEGGWFSDYDIMNYGFWPTEYDYNVVSTGKHLGGNAIYGTSDFYKFLIQHFLEEDFSAYHIIYKKNGKEIHHISDMVIMDKILPEKKVMTLDTLTHFSNALVQDKSKIDCVLNDPRTKIWL